MTDDDYEFDGDDFEDDCHEPIGSCDECGCDVYEYDCWVLDGDDLCGQCYWWATVAPNL